MSRRANACLLSALSMGITLGATSASAQEAPPRASILWGGEVSGTYSGAQDTAFFNYTSYEQDTLRLARVRLMFEVRLPGRVDVLAEGRSENDTADVPTAFVRWQPTSRAPFYLQAGRIPLVIGAFSRRSYGAENVAIGLPMAYQYLTSLRPDALPATADDVLRMRGRGWLSSFPVGNPTPHAGVPLIALETSDTGVQAHWAGATWTAAVAFTVGTPAAPRFRENNRGRTWSGRVATMRPSGLSIGVSAATGPWIDSDVTGVDSSSVGQVLLGLDVELARGHWIVRGEWWRSAFEVPTIDRTLVAHSGFVETRYRWRPRWHSAVRLDRVTFSDLSSTTRTVPWDAPVWRVEVVTGYRILRGLEARVGWQHNWRQANRLRAQGFPIAQAIWWF